jgi:hypothetical protein
MIVHGLDRLTPRRIGWWTLLVAAAALAAGLLLAAGGISVLLFAGLGILGVAALCSALAAPADRRFVVTAVTAALLGRYILGAGLQLWLNAGRDSRALFPDESGYFVLATELAHRWSGAAPVHPEVHSYLLDPNVTNSFVYAIAVVFLLVGDAPVAARVLDSIFGVLTAFGVYRTMGVLGLVGGRRALLALLAYPTIVLWSILGLKDAYSIFLTVAVMWLTAEFVHSGRWSMLLGVVPMLVLVESIRKYLFLMLLLAWPLGVLFGTSRKRMQAFLVAAGLSAVLLMLSPASASLISTTYIAGLNGLRANMAAGARSAFVPTPTPHPTPTALTAAPADSETPNSSVTTGTSRPAASPTAGNTVRPQRTPGPPVLSPAFFDEAVAVSLRHLPIGALFLLVAPFPLLARSPGEIAMIPEMLVWYLTIGFAAVGIARLIRTGLWRRIVLPLVTLGLLFVLLSLAEGNVGTLVRHRAMIIPFVVMFAAIGAEPGQLPWLRKTALGRLLTAIG